VPRDGGVAQQLGGCGGEGRCRRRGRRRRCEPPHRAQQPACAAPQLQGFDLRLYRIWMKRSTVTTSRPAQRSCRVSHTVEHHVMLDGFGSMCSVRRSTEAPTAARSDELRLPRCTLHSMAPDTAGGTRLRMRLRSIRHKPAQQACSVVMQWKCGTSGRLTQHQGVSAEQVQAVRLPRSIRQQQPEPLLRHRREPATRAPRKPICEHPQLRLELRTS
jgi:hypothetical protein